MRIDIFSDRELASKIKLGDLHSFDLIYKRYSARIYSFAFGLLKSKNDSEDLVQEVFIKLWNIKEGINENLSIKSFLFTIAYNMSITVIRKKIKKTEFVDLVSALQEPIELTLNSIDIEYKELEASVNKIIEELPNRQKAVYKLSREEELSYKEISKKLCISINTVENHMVKALRHIRTNVSLLNGSYN